MRLLIVGANGFIGSNLVRTILADRDWDVSCVDLTSDRLQRFAKDPRFTFTEADITHDHALVDDLVRDADIVLPLAAIATPISYIREPVRVVELTFEANLHIVRSCLAHGKRVVFPSSSEVYGMNSDEEFEEGTSNFVLGPTDKHRWIYACSKQLLDRVIHAYGLEQNLQYTIFRPFNWIGPNLDRVLDPREGSSRVLTQFIGNVVRRDDIRLVDGGLQRRCFCYVDDAVDCLLRIIENEGGRASQQIFNIGNPRNDVSVRELAEMLIDLMSTYPGFEDVRERVACVDVASKEYYGEGYQDIATRMPSITRARQLLGWEPRTDLETAIRKTVEFYKAEIEGTAFPSA